MKTFQQEGFTLIEAMIAIALIMIGLSGVFVLINRSLGFHNLAFHRLVAAQLAQEGIEIVRNLRDSNWLAGRAWNEGLNPGIYQIDYQSLQLTPYLDQNLLFDEENKVFTYEKGRSTPYKRKIEITQVSPDELKVIVTVFWKGVGGASFDLVVEDHLFNWY